MVQGQSPISQAVWCRAAPRHASDQVTWRHLLTRVFYSRQAIQKYIKANNKLGDVTDAMFKSHVNRAIQSGEKSGVFTRPKGEFRAFPTLLASMLDACRRVLFKSRRRLI
jgi:hypothetical protein